jgi:hypothetical protein
MVLWARRSGGVICLLLTLAGCANVKVHKVDLQDRVTGADDKVKGFRYYLTRPYLVLATRVTVSRSYVPVWVAVPKVPGTSVSPCRKPGEPLYLVAAVPDESGVHRVYDQAGHCTELTLDQVDILKGQAIPVQPGGGNRVGGNRAVDLKSLQEAILKAVGLRMAKVKSSLNTDQQEQQKVAAKLLALFQEAGDTRTQVTRALGEGNVAGAVEVGTKAAVAAANDYLSPLKLPATAADEIMAEVRKQLDPAPSNPQPASPEAQPSQVAALATLKAAASNADANKPADQPPGTSQTQDTLPFQVVFLPDFEEQYAISNCNVFAKTKYRYVFRNGTDLESVSGSYNSVDVPIKIVETVGALITAIGGVAKARLGGADAGGTTRLSLGVTGLVETPFYIRFEHCIEPGVYRVQKSWERAATTPLADLPADQLCGLFADVGLPIVESVAVIDRATHKLEAEKQPPAAPPPPKN